jgi:hypothetical protein
MLKPGDALTAVHPAIGRRSGGAPQDEGAAGSVLVLDGLRPR